MSGSAQNNDLDERTLEGMDSSVEGDNLFYSNTKKPRSTQLAEASELTELSSSAHGILALMAQHQLDGNDV